MIDGSNSSIQWQKHRTDILILPVGSFEQHGPHLTLDNDTRMVEYTSKIVAEYFDAALLPAISIGNSFEHTGFRGSFSLRPETLMQIIRDISDEAEKQNFKILVILHFYNGNFSLGPVCRDINSQNRGIKLLLHNPFDLADTYGCEDFNLFGSGYYNAEGLIGTEPVTLGQGMEYIDTLKEKMLTTLAGKIKKLHLKSRYSGRGGLTERTIDSSDINELIQLTESMHWNQLANDWKLFIEGGIALSMLHQGKIAGSCAALNWENRLAWIGLVLTDVKMRGIGIAGKLLKKTLEELKNCRTIKLDASKLGAPIYQKFGFVEESVILRFSRQAPLNINISAWQWKKLTAEDLPDIIAMESKYTGHKRLELWNFYLQNHPESAVAAWREGKIEAFALGRPGRYFRQLGPLGANSMEAAQALLAYCSHMESGSPFQLDVPEEQSAWVEFLRQNDFKFERDFLRMRLGEECGNPSCKTLYAIFGPEMG